MSVEITVPEIQLPFEWNAANVRDFIYSLCFGYPVGYFIACRSPSVRLKGGFKSAGRRILIDGQQRAATLPVAMLGLSIGSKNPRRHASG